MFRRSTQLLFCFVSALLIMSGRNGLAQQKKTASKLPSPPLAKTSLTTTANASEYTYTVIFNFDKIKLPDGGKLAHLGGDHIGFVDLNDNNDVAISFTYGAKSAIWKNGEYVAYTGQEVTSSNGYKTKIDKLGKPSLSPDGKVRYRATYLVDVGDKTAGKNVIEIRVRDGYFSDKRLIYERDFTGDGDPLRDGLFTPDDKVFLFTPSKSTIVKQGSFCLNGLPTNLFPSGNVVKWGVNPITGHTYAVAMIEHVDSPKGMQWQEGIFINGALKVRLAAQEGIVEVFLDEKDRLAYCALDPTAPKPNYNKYVNYVDGHLSRYKGWLLGFNSNQDMLLQSGGTPYTPLRVNDKIVVVPQFQERQGNPEFIEKRGSPVIEGLGRFSAYTKSLKLNNKGAVAFAGSFTGEGHRIQEAVVLASPGGGEPCPDLSAEYNLAKYIDEHHGEIPCCISDEIKQKYEKNQTNAGSGLWFSGSSTTGHVYLAINSLGKYEKNAREVEGVLEQNFGEIFPGGATDEDPSAKDAKVQKGHYYYIGRLPIPSEADVFVESKLIEIESLGAEAFGIPAEAFRTFGKGMQTYTKPKVKVDDAKNYYFILVATPHHVVEGTAIHGVFKDKCGELWMFQQGLGIPNESIESSFFNSLERAKPMWIEMADNLKHKLQSLK